MVVIDGIEGDKFDKIEGLALSPDSKRLIYEGLRNNRHYVVVDGAARGGYDDVKSLTFSPDGNRAAYAAMRGEKWFLVLDETEHEEEYDNIGSLLFSSDSQHVAFSANVGKGKTTYDILKYGEYEMKETQTISGKDGFGMPKFEKQRVRQPNEKGWKRLDKAGGKWLVVVDNQKQKGYNRVSNLTFVPGHKRVVYWAEKGDKWVIVIGGREYGKYDGLVNCNESNRRFIKGKFVPDCPFFFSSGKKFCALAEKDGKIFRIEIELQAN